MTSSTLDALPGGSGVFTGASSNRGLSTSALPSILEAHGRSNLLFAPPTWAKEGEERNGRGRRSRIPERGPARLRGGRIPGPAGGGVRPRGAARGGVRASLRER